MNYKRILHQTEIRLRLRSPVSCSVRTYKLQHMEQDFP